MMKQKQRSKRVQQMAQQPATDKLISLYPIPFQEAVQDLLKVKPAPKISKRKARNPTK
jgi:hypothetical protein